MQTEPTLDYRYRELAFFEKFDKAVDYVENDFFDKFSKSGKELEVYIGYNQGVATVLITGELRLLDMVELLDLDDKSKATLKHYIEVGVESVKLIDNYRYNFDVSYPFGRQLKVHLGYKNINWGLLDKFEEMIYEYITDLNKIYKDDVEKMMADPYVFDRV